MPIGKIKVSSSIQEGLDAFFAFIPNLIGFLVILIVGYLIARIVKGIIGKALEKLGVDKALHESEAGEYVEKVSPGASPSKLIGSVAFWVIFLFVFTAAIGALKIPAVTSFMDEVLAYLPNVIAAVLIFVVAAIVAGLVGGLVAKLLGDTATGKVVATAVPSLVMVIAVFMILNQLQIAPQIVTITYAALIGSVALGAALAFGLGGRDVAGKMLSDAYDKGKDRKDEVKRDVEKGKERAQDRAAEAKERAQGESGGGAAPGPAGA